jgi:arylsulfatase A-like enzyme
VLLVVLDTTRADRLGVNGYGPETTPHLDAFAEQAVRFERAYSTSSWTVAAHGSLFTGMLPVTHGATQENLRLDDELRTLSEYLSASGYQTAAFTNNSWISQVTLLSQGFDTVVPLWKERAARVPANAHPTNRSVLDWLEKYDGARPWFAFINYVEPHWPYTAPQEYRARFADSEHSLRVRKRAGFPAINWYLGGRRASPEVLRARIGLYDAEVAYLDAVLGALFDELRERSQFDDTLIIVTSDHGENLGERRHQGHSFTLYDSTLRIPLLIRRPGGASAAVRTDPVQLTDVFATVLAAVGSEVDDPRVTGRDLLQGPLPEERPVVAEYYEPRTFIGRFPDTPKARAAVAPFRRRLRSIQVGSEKLIWGSDGRHELYETSLDPGELDNRIERDPERARALEMQLATILAGLERDVSDPQPPLSEMDPEAIERLRELGYVP